MKKTSTKGNNKKNIFTITLVLILAIILGFIIYRFFLKDTSPPKIIITESNIYVPLNQYIEASDLPVSIEDSSDTTIYFLEKDQKVTHVYLENAGVQELCIIAEDAHGNSTTQQLSVTAEYAPQIHHSSSKIWSEVNKYDAGISNESSMEDTLEYMLPTTVHLFHQIDENKQIAGSGFIMEITEQYVYICTNRHVVKDYSDWDIYFYDGTKLTGTKVGYSEGYDVGVVKVALTEIPSDLVSKLMTVHIDMNYWAQLTNQKIEIGLIKINREGGIEHTLQGTLIALKEDFAWGNHQPHTEIKLDQSAGDSGSAIFDQRGYLIAMVYGTSHEENGDRNWGVPLDALVECYNEITKQ